MTNASDEPDAGRFEVEVGGQAAELVYRVDADLLILVHTEVPSELAGHGVGGRLMRAAIKKATRDGLTIARCAHSRGAGSRVTPKTSMACLSIGNSVPGDPLSAQGGPEGRRSGGFYRSPDSVKPAGRVTKQAGPRLADGP